MARARPPRPRRCPFLRAVSPCTRAGRPNTRRNSNAQCRTHARYPARRVPLAPGVTSDLTAANGLPRLLPGSASRLPYPASPGFNLGGRRPKDADDTGAHAIGALLLSAVCGVIRAPRRRRRLPATPPHHCGPKRRSPRSQRPRPRCPSGSVSKPAPSPVPPKKQKQTGGVPGGSVAPPTRLQGDGAPGLWPSSSGCSRGARDPVHRLMPGRSIQPPGRYRGFPVGW